MAKPVYPMEYDDETESIRNIDIVNIFRKSVFDVDYETRRTIAENTIKTIYDQCKCCLTLDVMTDPVFLDCCGSSFEGSEIKIIRDQKKRCPKCRSREYKIIKNPHLNSICDHVSVLRDIVKDYIRILESAQNGTFDQDKMDVDSSGKQEIPEPKDALFTDEHLDALMDFVKRKRKRQTNGFAPLKLTSSCVNPPAPSLSISLEPQLKMSTSKDIEQEILKSLSLPAIALRPQQSSTSSAPVPSRSFGIEVTYGTSRTVLFEKFPVAQMLLVFCVASSTGKNGVDELMNFTKTLLLKYKHIAVSIMLFRVRSSGTPNWDAKFIGTFSSLNTVAKSLTTVQTELNMYCGFTNTPCRMKFQDILEAVIIEGKKKTPVTSIVMLVPNPNFIDFDTSQNAQLSFLLEAYKDPNPLMTLDVITTTSTSSLTTTFALKVDQNVPFKYNMTEPSEYSSEYVRFWVGHMLKFAS